MTQISMRQMSQVSIKMSASSSAFKGQTMRLACPPTKAVSRQGLTVISEEERFRLSNLQPLPGSRRKEQRKGRGRGAGQGLTCGYGNRGQKARSGPGVRPGFEGGQNPLYRAMPKLKGICGGMSAGQQKFVTVNLKDIVKFGLDANTEVSLDSLKAMGKLSPTGYSRDLPLKVLGEGELGVALTFKAAAFSASAVSKIEAAGGSIEVLPQKVKWTRQAHEAKIAAATEA
mmetsp:Transcript_10015/g.13628  ORF Transcript_10015/g.13628 Transcript_10015/m.13628 type:complete len:229 (-) Transcript_10015:135-821(-)